MDPFDRAPRRGLTRLAFLAAVVGAQLGALPVARAQSTLQPLPSALPSSPPVGFDLATLPSLGTVTGERPAQAGPTESQLLAQANAEAMKHAATLAALTPPLVEVKCDPKVVRFGDAPAGTPFTLRPSQLVLLQGCFDGLPRGAMRLNGVGGGGTLTLELVAWHARYVLATMPTLRGMLDQPMRLQLAFADGSLSQEVTGRFIASRAKYEISGQAIQNLIRVDPVPPPFASDFHSWLTNVDGLPAVAPPLNRAPNGVYVRTTSMQTGAMTLAPKGPAYHQIHGFTLGLRAGKAQAGTWGAQGEVTLAWTTGAHVGAHLHYVVVEKLVIEAPLGTVTGKLLSN